MTTLVVQKDKLLFNYRALQNYIGVQVIPVLSSNAYGIGDTETARVLSDAGAELIAVSRVEEAERLSSAVDTEILLLTPYCTEHDAERIVSAGITATIGSYDSAVLLNGIAEKKLVKCRVHIEFDTGAGRFGFLPEEAEKAAQAAKYLKNLEICGCFTQLSGKDGKNKRSAYRQLEQFSKCIETLKRSGINPGILHIANSSAAIMYPKLRLNAVRCGSGLLGRIPVRGKLGLKTVGRLQSEICDVRWIPAKHNIGISDTYKTNKPVRIAVIPIGYADGLFIEKMRESFRFRDIFHSRRSRLYCEILDVKVPIIGAVEPCYVIADVSAIKCDAGDIASFDTNPLLVNSHVKRSYI